MAYHMYLNGVEFPVMPSKLQMKIKGTNKTMTLINDSEINQLKEPGLTEISFDVEIPQVQHPYAVYPNGFQRASYYLDALENILNGKKPVQFIVTRAMPDGIPLFDTNLKVSLEEYTVKEDANNGFDLTVSIKLKKYRDYGTKTVEVIQKPDAKPVAAVTKQRDTSSKPATKQYKVVSGDTLWGIAKKHLGNGLRHKEIYNLNKTVIEATAKKRGLASSSNGHWIFPGTVLSLPEK